MKRIISLAVLALLTTSTLAGDVAVKGTIRKDGTSVAQHHRTAPNSTRTDNYSSVPNVNPYTGKAGRIDPYAPKKPLAAPLK